MSLYKALVSFSGEVAGAPGQVVEINDDKIAKDYIGAGYIEKLSSEDAKAEQGRRDAEAQRQADVEEARAKAADDTFVPSQPGPSASETQHALNEELRGDAKSKSAKAKTGSAKEATAAYEGAETNAQDAAANPKPTVNAAKSGQSSQGGVDVDPPKDPNSTLGTSQAEDDPAAVIPTETAEANQQAIEDQAKADKAAASVTQPRTVSRSAETGKIVSAEEAKANPGTTVTEKVK